ncbi:tyrosine-type recombinase/integrase [Streptosporangium sp. NPDC050280]|uniref:tyrosine-type recombinase/integrase n=1 Tax=Streptosporangium sp. NPDC050280 TaxID=3154934 RepID=UPI00343A0F01
MELAIPDQAGTAPIPAEPAYTAADFTISDSTRVRLADSVPANTRRAYTRQWNAFTTWCAANGSRVPLPATAQTFTDYVTHLADTGYAPASIEQAMGAIRSCHTTAGHEGQPHGRAALQVLRQHRRHLAENGQRHQKEAPPVTIPVLRAMVDACPENTVVGIRDRLLLVLGLALMGRRSELVALNRADVTQTEHGLDVAIRTSKTDKNSVGEIIAVPRGDHPLTDPVDAWLTWTRLLDEAGHHDGRLLRRLYVHDTIGRSLGGDAINEIVRSCAIRAGVPRAAEYTAHSLRAGGATVAYAAGRPISVIAKHGRWSPTSPVLLRYIRAVDRWRDNAMRGVGL